MDEIHNHIRGLSPYPAAFTTFIAPTGQLYPVKFFISRKEKDTVLEPIKSILTDSKNQLKIAVNGGYIIVEELQLAGKKKMGIQEFLRGFMITNEWRVD
jgi:methionyl-tRNA formyltransferase